MRSNVKLLSVSGSGNNCLYVAVATHLLSLVWTQNISGRQLDFLYQSVNSYLETEMPWERFIAEVSNPEHYADWSLILGVAIRHNLQRSSTIGEFMDQAVVLSEKLWVPKMVGVEIQGDFLASYYKEGNILREEFMGEISIHDLGGINDVPLINWAKDKDTLSIYMEGLTNDFNASAHCHYGLLVDPDIFSQDRGFVVHSEDPSRISSTHLPILTREGCNDPSFDWTSPNVKERLKEALGLRKPSIGASILMFLQNAFQTLQEVLKTTLAVVYELLRAIVRTLFMPACGRAWGESAHKTHQPVPPDLFNAETASETTPSLPFSKPPSEIKVPLKQLVHTGGRIQ